jgi:phasin family protein
MQAHPLVHDTLQHQLDLALQVAGIAIEGAEQLSRLQLDAAKQAAEQLTDNVARLGQAQDASALLAWRGELMTQSMENTLQYARGLYEIGTQMQVQLNKVMGERADALHRTLSGQVDRFAGQAPAGADVFIQALKMGMDASAAALDSMTRAARQVADFADASVKAATTATADAVKSVTPRK